jgi:hypothetical protein
METCITAGSQDRRRAQRHSLVLPIEWENGTGITCNVSTTGMFFKTNKRLTVNAQITFLLPGEQPYENIRLYFHGQGKIVRIKPYEGQWGVGIHFTSFTLKHE